MSVSCKKFLYVFFVLFILSFQGCGNEDGGAGSFTPTITFFITEEGKGQTDIRQKIGNTVGEVITCTVVTLLSEDLTQASVFMRVRINRGGADKAYTFDLSDIVRDSSGRIVTYRATVSGESVTIPPKITLHIQAIDPPLICSDTKVGILEIITFKFE